MNHRLISHCRQFELILNQNIGYLKHEIAIQSMCKELNANGITSKNKTKKKQKKTGDSTRNHRTTRQIKTKLVLFECLSIKTKAQSV